MRTPISKENAIKHKEALRILQTAGQEKWAFGRTFEELKALHLNRYEVDTTSGNLTFFWNDGTETVRPNEKNKTCTVGMEFDSNGIKNAINQSKNKTIDYDRFLELVCNAGCKNYEVNFQSRQIIYYGVNENNKVLEKVAEK